MDVCYDKNGNGNITGIMKTEEVCVLDGDRVGDVRLYKEDLVLEWRNRWRRREMDIVVCRVTKIIATTSEHVSCCHRWQWLYIMENVAMIMVTEGRYRSDGVGI